MHLQGKLCQREQVFRVTGAAGREVPASGLGALAAAAQKAFAEATRGMEQESAVAHSEAGEEQERGSRLKHPKRES